MEDERNTSFTKIIGIIFWIGDPDFDLKGSKL